MSENKYIYAIHYYDGDEGDLLSTSGTIEGKDFCDALNRLYNEYNWIEEIHMYMLDESKLTEHIIELAHNALS